MVYVDYVNILRVGVHNIKENEETLLVASKEIGLEVGRFQPFIDHKALRESRGIALLYF